MSPFDFRVTHSEPNEDVRIDAKSTSLDWEQPIHLSIAEINEAASEGRYDLWRLFEVEPGGAKLKVTENFGEFARKIRDSLSLPDGVTVDNVSLEPAQLEWFDQPDILITDDEEET